MPDDRKHIALTEYLEARKRLKEARRIYLETDYAIVKEHLDWCELQTRRAYQVCRSAGWRLEDLAMIVGAYALNDYYTQSLDSQ